MIQVIKTETEYQDTVRTIENLIDRNPEPGTPEADQLELLAVLVKDYEARNFKVPLPDPIEAIQFRMEQQGLSQRDLVPYFGSRSKVSEVLSRKRPLTLAMMRALHNGLGIPAKALLQEPEVSDLNDPDIEWSRFPIRDMVERGWISGKVLSERNEAESALRSFFATLKGENAVLALYRKTNHLRSARAMDVYALAAWTAFVMNKAERELPERRYKVGSVTLEFMRTVAKLSWSENGPLLAKEYLKNHGIPLVIEPHLPHTYLDGAAILIQADRPIIGLTLRYDRLDNFWFCLMHELAHLSLHMTEGITQFYDDLDIDPNEDGREREADSFAGEALIPTEAWKKSAASRLRSPEAAEDLARRLGVHPAIVAGRMRKEFKAYRLLSHLVGHRQVRKLFDEIKWGRGTNV
jgi:HTH-type transcriptional regulator/antitoxin HigA